MKSFLKYTVIACALASVATAASIQNEANRPDGDEYPPQFASSDLSALLGLIPIPNQQELERILAELGRMYQDYLNGPHGPGNEWMSYPEYLDENGEWTGSYYPTSPPPPPGGGGGGGGGGGDGGDGEYPPQ
jgi:hypothetical protein